MNITLTNLILIIVVAVCIIMPVLYSIVVTVLFVHGKREYADLDHQYQRLEDAYDNKVKMIEQRLQSDAQKGKSQRGPIGFAVTKEEASTGEKEPERDQEDMQ